MARKLAWRAVLMFVTVFAVAAFAGDVTIRRGAPALTGAVRWIAWALAATTVLLLVHGVPLALGVLSKGTVLAATAIAAMAAAPPRRAARGCTVPSRRRPDPGAADRCCSAPRRWSSSSARPWA